MAKERKKGTIAQAQKLYKVKVIAKHGIGSYKEGDEMQLPKSTAEALIKNKSAEKVGKW